MPTIKKYIIKPNNVKNPFQMRATSPTKYKQDLAIVKAPNVIEGGKPSYSGQDTSTSASSAVDIGAYSQGGIPSDFATSPMRNACFQRWSHIGTKRNQARNQARTLQLPCKNHNFSRRPVSYLFGTKWHQAGTKPTCCK